MRDLTGAGRFALDRDGEGVVLFSCPEKTNGDFVLIAPHNLISNCAQSALVLSQRLCRLSLSGQIRQAHFVVKGDNGMAKLEYRDRVIFWAIQITDGHCAYCGKEILCRSEMQLDHTTPIRVGSHMFHNQIIVPACSRCNSQKNRRTIEEYREYLKNKLGVSSVSFYIDKCNPVKFVSPNVLSYE